MGVFVLKSKKEMLKKLSALFIAGMMVFSYSTCDVLAKGKPEVKGNQKHEIQGDDTDDKKGKTSKEEKEEKKSKRNNKRIEKKLYIVEKKLENVKSDFEKIAYEIDQYFQYDSSNDDSVEEEDEITEDGDVAVEEPADEETHELDPAEDENAVEEEIVEEPSDEATTGMEGESDSGAVAETTDTPEESIPQEEEIQVSMQSIDTIQYVDLQADALEDESSTDIEADTGDVVDEAIPTEETAQSQKEAVDETIQEGTGQADVGEGEGTAEEVISEEPTDAIEEDLEDGQNTEEIEGTVDEEDAEEIEGEEPDEEEMEQEIEDEDEEFEESQRGRSFVGKLNSINNRLNSVENQLRSLDDIGEDLQSRYDEINSTISEIRSGIAAEIQNLGDIQSPVVEKLKKAVDAVEYEPEEDVVEQDKFWTVQFSGDVDASTIENTNIFVVDSNDNIVKVEVEILPDGNGIVIRPVEGYVSGEKYTLAISGIASEDGHQLDNLVKMAFEVY